MTGQDWLDKDFYSALGVKKNATADEIKKAYRKKARTMHPDANPDNPQAEADFKAVSEAYAVLSDEKQRQQYDAIRSMGGGARFMPGGNGFEDGFSGLFNGARGGANMPPGFEDILSGLFGQSSGRQGGPTGFQPNFGASPQAGDDITTTTQLTFRDAMLGTKASVRVGGGEPITIKIPAGVKEGQKIRVRGKGKPGSRGGADGDLLVQVHIKAHPVYSRDGNDLRMTVPVGFDEAVLGATISVPTFDGGTLKLKVPAGTKAGQVLRAKGRGVGSITGSGAPGDLLVTLSIATPQNLTPDMKAALEAWRTAVGDANPRDGLVERAAEA
ncbi:DnaJ domain-containing protein [Micrococcales bacterium 31B]|nr:DnaJ domain-containing protein [Micrococcales bacterium 31B]